MPRKPPEMGAWGRRLVPLPLMQDWLPLGVCVASLTVSETLGYDAGTEFSVRHRLA
jgi:hypothetical protein